MRSLTETFRSFVVTALRSFGYPVAAILDKEYFSDRAVFLQSLLERFDKDQALEWPPEPILGAGKFDERVVEYPSLVDFVKKKFKANGGAISMLDVGMTSNNLSVAKYLELFLKEIVFLNPRPDDEIVMKIRHQVIQRTMADYKGPFDHFDLAVSISTLEHIGFSNRQYGDLTPPIFSNPTTKPLLDFILLSRNVLKTAGEFMVTVPCGRRSLNLHPRTWQFASQTFDYEMIQEASAYAEALGFSVECRIFAIVGDDFSEVRENQNQLWPRIWKKRYGSFATAANSVAVLTGRRL